MKTNSIKKCLSILIILFSFGSGATHAKELHPFSHNFVAEKEIRKSDAIKLQNRYGDVKVEVWDKESIKVEVQITGETFDKTTLETFYQQIEADFLDLSNNASVAPPVSCTSNSTVMLFGLSKQKLSLQMKDGKKYEIGDLRIDYTAYVPDNHRLYTEIKYHGLNLKRYHGEVTVVHYNGSVNIDELTGKSSISVKYGAANIKKGKDLSMNIYDGSLMLEKAENINLVTKYSDVEIGAIRSASITSFDDNIEIGTLSTLIYNAKYTEFTCGNLESVTATLYEGELVCGSVKQVNLNAKYAEIELAEVDLLLFGSAYDCDFSVEKVDKCTIGSSKYSDIEIGQLSGSLTIASYDDDVSVDWVQPAVDRITISSKYGDFDLTMDKGFHHQVASNTQYGDFDYPNDYYKTDSRIVNGSSTILTAKTIGGNANSKLTVTGYSTDFEIQVK